MCQKTFVVVAPAGVEATVIRYDKVSKDALVVGLYDEAENGWVGDCGSDSFPVHFRCISPFLKFKDFDVESS